MLDFRPYTTLKPDRFPKPVRFREMIKINQLEEIEHGVRIFNLGRFHQSNSCDSLRIPTGCTHGLWHLVNPKI